MTGEGYMTAEELADELRVNRDTIYRELAEGRWVAFRVGRLWRIPRPPQRVPETVNGATLES